MDWTRLSWLTARRDRRSSSSPDDDPAGMGTAFGLDAVDGGAGWDREPAPQDGAATTASATEVTWNDRIVRRSGL